MDRIKVLIVDDSAIVRDLLSAAVEAEPDMSLCGTAPDPFIARDKIVRLRPDVVTLDIELPRLDGITFLERLMQYYPIPVIIVSSISASDPQAAIRALEVGAFDVINKPGGRTTVSDVKGEVLEKIRNAYECRESFIAKWKDRSQAITSIGHTPLKRDAAPRIHLANISTSERLIAIGASTGGTVALEFILSRLAPTLPPLVIAQHMPAMFTKQFANRLDDLCEGHVKEGEDKELLVGGTIYIAPGNFHMEVHRRGASLFIRLSSGNKVNFQRPAADILFASVAREAGPNAIGILLTGMGRDGAEGLLAMKRAGAKTIAQDERSSIVWGMPGAAVEIGAVDQVLPLDQIPAAIHGYGASGKIKTGTGGAYG